MGAPLAKPEAFLVSFPGEGLEGVLAAGEPLEQPRDDWPEDGIRHDDAPPIGAHSVHVARRRERRVQTLAGFGAQSLPDFFAEVVDVVLGQDDPDAVQQLVAGPTVPGDGHILCDEVNLHIQVVHQDVVLQIAVEAVSLLHQERPAGGAVPFEVGEQGRKTRTARLLGGLYVEELRVDSDLLLLGVLAQEGLLGRDAESLALLVLAGHSGVQDRVSGGVARLETPPVRQDHRGHARSTILKFGSNCQRPKSTFQGALA